MSYSGEIQKLNSSLSSISAVNLDPKFDTWEGTAKTKQVANVNNLKSTLDSQTGMVKTLIDALTAIDEYDTNKSEYDKYCALIGNLDSQAPDYASLLSSYSSSRDSYKKAMDDAKSSADTALGSINSGYKTTLKSIAVTKAVDTTISLLPEKLLVASNDTSTTTDPKKESPNLTINDSTNTSNNTNNNTYSGPTFSSGPRYVESYPTVPSIESPDPNNYVVDKIDMSNVPPAPTETICAANMSLNVKSSRKDIKSKFSKETQEIVSKHANDFNYSNFRQYIKNDEDFEKYCKEVLGGVFAKWTGKKKKGKGKTASEFQEISEYVFGLMVMYGFDYCNGDPDHYGKFGANNADVSTNAFYPKGVYNSAGRNNNTDTKNIDKICAGTQEDGINMTTNCNYGMDYLYHKAGILGVDGAPSSSCAVGSLAKYAKKRGGGVTTNASELKVGDLIECYRNNVPASAATVENAGNLKEYGWYHVCCVGEVEKNAAGETVAVVLYDAGHRFTNGGNFKYRVELKNNNLRSLGDYGSKWVGIQMNLTQDSYTAKK